MEKQPQQQLQKQQRNKKSQIEETNNEEDEQEYDNNLDKRKLSSIMCILDWWWEQVLDLCMAGRRAVVMSGDSIHGVWHGVAVELCSFLVHGVLWDSGQNGI